MKIKNESTDERKITLKTGSCDHMISGMHKMAESEYQFSLPSFLKAFSGTLALMLYFVYANYGCYYASQFSLESISLTDLLTYSVMPQKQAFIFNFIH